MRQREDRERQLFKESDIEADKQTDRQIRLRRYEGKGGMTNNYLVINLLASLGISSPINVSPSAQSICPPIY